MRITKEMYIHALQALNAEGAQRKDKWLGLLTEITNEEPYKESAASLTHMVLSNLPAFEILARRNIQKYMTAHPEVKQPEQAMQMLLVQMSMRLVVYVMKHAEESAELQDMFDLPSKENGK